MRITLVAAAVVCALARLPAAARERPPSIVLILADDLGWGDVGFNGRREWRTPNLDRLARQGTRFTRWYTAAVVCAPSRAALLTGRYGIHNGVSGNADDLPAGEVTLAEALRARGYATALFGKWHHGSPRPGSDSYVHPMDQGFDEFFGFTDARHAWEKRPRELWNGRRMEPVEGYADTLFADRAVEFIARSRDRPFFLYLPFTNCHFHVEAPEEDVARFRGRFPERDPAAPANAHYAAMAERLDKEVGRVLEALRRAGIERDTLVVFSSDHGATFEAGNRGASAFHDSNRPFRGQKRTLWEGGIRVPGVVRWPVRVPAGRDSDAVVHMIDVMPTLLAAAGAAPEPAWGLDGLNLLPLWTGEAKEPDRTLFWEWRSEGTHQTAAMRGRMKLVVTRGAPAELYDVVADPAERRNLAAEQPDLAASLAKELAAWLETESDASRWGKPDRARPVPAGRTGARSDPAPSPAEASVSQADLAAGSGGSVRATRQAWPAASLRRSGQGPGRGTGASPQRPLGAGRAA